MYDWLTVFPLAYRSISQIVEFPKRGVAGKIKMQKADSLLVELGELV